MISNGRLGQLEKEEEQTAALIERVYQTTLQHFYITVMTVPPSSTRRPRAAHCKLLYCRSYHSLLGGVLGIGNFYKCNLHLQYTLIYFQINAHTRGRTTVINRRNGMPEEAEGRG
jgi:hypothetical protein